MDIKSANTNFSVEQLLNGKLNKNQFKVDFNPMWHFLDNMERKVGGFKNIDMKQVLEAVYEFATISVSLDKADMTTRIDSLNEANLKWFTKATDLEKEVEILRLKLQESQSTKENS